MKYAFILSSTLLITSCSANDPAAIITRTQVNNMTQFLSEFLPSHYQKVYQQDVLSDQQHVQLVRYQKLPLLKLNGENFSYLSDQTGALKGFSYLDESLLNGHLPTKAQAQKISDDFLQHYAPDLLQHREIHWIDQHDENVHINGKTQKIAGIKVKMRNLNDGRWFWVIIGKNQRPIIFERDIVWASFPGHRKTEKWLHDSWAKDHLIIKGQSK